MNFKIKFKIGNIEKEFTLEELRELKEILNEIFPNETKVIIEKEYIPTIYPPIIINPEPYKWNRWEITGTDGTEFIDQPSITICYAGD